MPRLFEKRKYRRTDTTKQVVVFYHADCTDGFTAAWVAWKKFGEKARYIAQFHEDPPPVLKNKLIYTLDMTFPESITKKLMKDNQVTSIDHHISTKSVTLSTHQPSYALHHSGCVLAWKYFFPDKAAPKFLLNIEDVDLWNNKIPKSNLLYVYLELSDFSFGRWSQVISDFEISAKRKKILDTGALLRKHDDEMIRYDIDKNAKIVKLQGHRVYAINTTHSASLIGAKLARMLPPFSIIWKENKSGRVIVSLRGDGTIDCSKIAQKYGGGGHRDSAAFRLNSLQDIPWKAVK